MKSEHPSNGSLHPEPSAFARTHDPVAHDIEFGLFLTEHDGQRIGVTFEQYGVEVNVSGLLRLTLDPTYWIGDRRFDCAAPRGAEGYEGFPIRWAALS